jgi:aminoglycoside phosphotransferase
MSELDTDYLLTADIGGKMLCDDIYRNNPTLAVSLLAEGINRLRSIDISKCPIWNDLSRRLTEAADNIKLNRIDMDNWEPSSDQFSSPQDLLEYLITNKPKDEELVFTHGDYCLPKHK